MCRIQWEHCELDCADESRTYIVNACQIVETIFQISNNPFYTLYKILPYNDWKQNICTSDPEDWNENLIYTSLGE